MRSYVYILSLAITWAVLSPLHGQELSAPEKNFEVLWKTFHERYAFFKLRGVDWREQYRVFRPKVKSTTSDEDLFRILCDMLKPLKDGHVNLKAKGLREGKFNAEDTPRFLKEFNTRKLEKSYKELVSKTLEDRGFGEQNQATDLLVYSRSKNFGYLLITEFEGVKAGKLDAALDKVLGELAGVKGLIIDIRLNPGGTDQCVYQIASRFADKERIGHYRKTRKGAGSEDFSPLKARYLKPAGEIGSTSMFTGPIVLLTHDASFSGADVFAMVMADLPHVTIIGEPTNGIFSNMLERKLPNGWKYTLSSQVYYSAAKICYESKGVPVDIPLLNMRGDLEKGSDPLIVKSMEVLSAK